MRSQKTCSNLKHGRSYFNFAKSFPKSCRKPFPRQPFCNVSAIVAQYFCYAIYQRWSPRGRPWPRGRPRGQILKSLASKVKSLALRPQVLENWPVLGSRTAPFFELLKFWGAPEKFFGKCFFVVIA